MTPDQSVSVDRVSAGSRDASEVADPPDHVPDLSGLRVAYFCHRFPYFTATFVAREIFWLREFGADVQVFSLLPPRDEPVHERSQALLPYTHYAGLLDRKVVLSNLRQFWRRPRRYLEALGGVVWQTFGDTKAMAAALATFPKSVYFAEHVERRGIQHVHTHFVWLGGIAASVAAKLLGITYSTMPHAFGLFSRPPGAVARQLRWADRVITISDYHRRYIAELDRRLEYDQIDVVHCGIETDRFAPHTSARRGPPVILSVGRLIEKKGHGSLIEACSMLAERGLDFRCVIIGGGPRMEQYRTRVRELDLADRVEFLGGKTQEEILRHYQDSDIFALPCVMARSGDRDGIPIALMEAMACGLPVVTTSISGIPELVQPENGMLVEEKDVYELANALERLLRDPALRERLGSAGRESVVAGFDARRNVAEVGSRLQSIVQRERRGVR